MQKVLIFDAETTGTVEPEIIEAAWIQVDGIVELDVIGHFEARYKPSKPIELGALATHHILDEDLEDEPDSSLFALPGDITYLVGHNIDYDWQVAGSPDVKRICTLAISRMLFPNVDSHKLGAMAYLLLDRVFAREQLLHAHRAMCDVMSCRMILAKILELMPSVTTWEELWEKSEEARIPTVMPFGKHKGMAIADVPVDYVMWLLKQPDVDPYLVKAFKNRGR